MSAVQVFGRAYPVFPPVVGQYFAINTFPGTTDWFVTVAPKGPAFVNVGANIAGPAGVLELDVPSCAALLALVNHVLATYSKLPVDDPAWFFEIWPQKNNVWEFTCHHPPIAIPASPSHPAGHAIALGMPTVHATGLGMPSTPADEPEDLTPPPACQCGAAAVGVLTRSSAHSPWCPAFRPD